MSQDRVIDIKYLVNSEKGPLTLSENKKRAEIVLKSAKQKGLNAKMRQLFLPADRMNELGINLFRKKPPCDINEIQNFRNSVFVEFHNNSPTQETSPYIWKKVSRKYGISDSMEEFNQHCLDILEYYYSERT
jgi:hypothetical protein